MSSYMKFKEFHIQQQISGLRDALTLSVIDDATLNIVEDQQGNFMQLNPNFEVNFNYSSLYSPAMTRYTGMSSQTLKNFMANQDQGEDSYPKTNVSIAKNPSTPTFILKNELHVRTKQIGTTVNNNVASNFNIRLMYYFDTELNDATQNRIKQFIAVSQSQVTYLALIVIVIICSIVMCFSYQ